MGLREGLVGPSEGQWLTRVTVYMGVHCVVSYRPVDFWFVTCRIEFYS